MKFSFIACLIALDIISGLIYALKSKTWTSTKMREGFFHKMSIIILIVLAVLCDLGQKYLNLGFNIPLANGALGYTGFMEIGSICENLVKTNPELKLIVRKLFSKKE